MVGGYKPFHLSIYCCISLPAFSGLCQLAQREKEFSDDDLSNSIPAGYRRLSAGIATGYGLDDRGVGVRVPVG
jgi:hypothetical protein